jgi:predicted nucleic acid-binding Zn ribbon protein
MLSLFRNPLFVLLGRFWWLAVVALAVARAAGGEAGLRFAAYGLLMFAAALGGLAAAAFAHGAWKTVAARVRRRVKGHSFLCPHCLHVDRFRYACGACGDEADGVAVLTGGAYVNDCPHCRAELFPRERAPELRAWAYCGNCFGVSGARPHHERRVAVAATLLAEDFDTLREFAGAREQRAKDRLGFFCLDDGETLQYVLDCGGAEADEAGPLDSHALRLIESVWVDAAGVEPLRFGRAVDAFIRRARLNADERGEILVCVRQPELEAFARNRLEAQFKNIRYGVEPGRVLRGKDAAGAAELAPPGQPGMPVLTERRASGRAAD